MSADDLPAVQLRGWPLVRMGSKSGCGTILLPARGGEVTLNWYTRLPWFVHFLAALRSSVRHIKWHSTMLAYLIVVGSKLDGKTVRLKLPAIIGRGKGSALRLPLSLVSRQHCEIFGQNGKIMVRDLGSLNGTVVDGERVSEAELGPEQLLTVGSLTFRVLDSPPGLANTTKFKTSDSSVSAPRRQRRKRSASSSKPGRARKTTAPPDSADSADLVNSPSPVPREPPLTTPPPVAAEAITSACLSSSSMIANPDQFLPPVAADLAAVILPMAQTPVVQPTAAAASRPAAPPLAAASLAAPLATIVRPGFVPGGPPVGSANGAIGVSGPTTSGVPTNIPPPVPTPEQPAGGPAAEDDEDLTAFLKSLGR